MNPTSTEIAVEMTPSTSTNMGSIEDLNTMKQKHTINIPPPQLPPPKLPRNIKSTYRFPLRPPNLPCTDLLGSRDDYFGICVPLYRASNCGDWAAAKATFDIRPELVRYAITEGRDTALHVAASAEETKLTERFVENLVNLMESRDLELQNQNSKTALYLAAAAGNVKIARIMVRKHAFLPSIPGSDGMLPLYIGALHGRHDIVKFLYDTSFYLNLMDHNNRDVILLRCVECDFFDVALKIVTDRPELTENASSLLGVLARKPGAFNRVEQNLIWRIINSIFRIIHMEGPAKKNADALKLLRIIWRHTIRTMPKDKVVNMLRGPPTVLADVQQQYSSRILFVAAEMGNTRFVVELLRVYPDLIWQTNDDNYSIFHIAIVHRHQDIYNLLYEIDSRKDLITLLKDKDDNNMLHLVGLTSRNTAAKTSGASLLMQRELLWLKEVEQMIPPAYREEKNKYGQTPYEIFSKNNHSLVGESLKWVKECMVVTTLIVTIAFAVAFTVPGGYNQDNGFPIFIHERTFLVFVIADAVSLFSSSTSLLVYLSILASRYDRHDSLFSLTKKLMIGLVTLFISVAAMMVTFSASFFVLYRNGLKWVPILIVTFVVMPITAFATLQHRLLVDMFPSMYDSTIQFKPRKRMLYVTSKNFMMLSCV